MLSPDLDPVGPLAFGCWRFTGEDVASCRRVLEVALDAGMNLVDTADLYLIHRPDLFTHPHAVAETLTALQARLTFPIAATQPEFSAAELSPLRDGTLDLCMQEGVVPLAWSPLAGGRLVRREADER